MSNLASFPSTISPEVFDISLSLGKMFSIVIFLFFDRKDPIVDSSDLFSTEELVKISEYKVIPQILCAGSLRRSDERQADIR